MSPTSKRVAPAASGPQDVLTVGKPAEWQVQDLKDGYASVDWSQSEDLCVYTIAGEPVKFMDLCKDARTVIMFLRRFECQTWLGLYGVKHKKATKKSRLNLYIYTRRQLYRYLVAWLKIPEKKYVWKQTPGIVVVENHKLLYRFISRDQYNPLPGSSDGNLASALACAAPDVELLDEKVTDGLRHFAEIMDDPLGGGPQKAENLKLLSRLGKGKESEVFLASWMGLKVAVKFFKIEGTVSKDEHGTQQIDQGLKSFANEAAILMSLRHKNIIPFLGFGHRAPHQFLIMELMPKGSLFQLLGEANVEMNAARKHKILMDTATGIFFLHSCTPLVVHQDLKSLNLLVAEDWTVKVADFGIAHANKAKTSAKLDENDDGIAGGTIAWMSPEHLSFEGKPSTKMDCFSFAVIMWEVASRERPWKGVTGNMIEEKVRSGKRLEIKESWNGPFVKLLMSCWAQSPNNRPEFKAILKMLPKITIPT
ncbi:hypothetical protein HDU97_001922 [Phlyctochytrium planicorne]|nr:hypothetical protein HDU97_001922 [Phlyctochytrium planicorne]